MRSPSAKDTHPPSPSIVRQVEQIHSFAGNDQLMAYSLSQLQEMTSHQHEHIRHNQQLLISREQRLKHLKQQHTFRSKQRVEQGEMKELRLRALQHQLHQQRNGNYTFENEVHILTQIFVSKEDELKRSTEKVDELGDQLEQIRRVKMSATKEQLQHRNELDKVKQELAIRHQLNEQQSRQIAYQREIYASKQTTLSQLNARIGELQQQLTTQTTLPATVAQPTKPVSGFQRGLDSVQSTLNNINIAEIERRMVQLANSFSLIHTNKSNSVNSTTQSFAASPSILSVEMFTDTDSEVAATLVTCSPNISTSSSPVPTSLPVISNEPPSAGKIQSLVSQSDEQLPPVNLRLNEDILSLHFADDVSDGEKRNALVEHLPTSTDFQQVAVEVRDDSSTNLSSLDTETMVLAHDDLQQEEDEEQEKSIIDSLISNTESEGSLSDDMESILSLPMTLSASDANLKSLLKTPATPKNTSRRVAFDPLALLLDAAVLGELELVAKSAKEVENASQPNDEGLTALHNAVCAAHLDCVRFLVEFGCDINYPDNDGWTPLHCAASCNHTSTVQFLIEHGACLYATTIRDNETAAHKCEEDEENYAHCSQYLLKAQNDLGVINDGLVYAVYDYQPDVDVSDELQFRDGDRLRVLRREDEHECHWWWTRHEQSDKEGYVPRNYLGLYPRVRPASDSSTH